MDVTWLITHSDLAVLAYKIMDNCYVIISKLNSLFYRRQTAKAIGISSKKLCLLKYQICITGQASINDAYIRQSKLHNQNQNHPHYLSAISM